MKRTLYPKLLGGYLIYGLICFIIIWIITYTIMCSYLLINFISYIWIVDKILFCILSSLSYLLSII